MDKEFIISMLNDSDIKSVTYITIQLSMEGMDRCRIDYMDNEGKFKTKVGYYDYEGR